MPAEIVTAPDADPSAKAASKFPTQALLMAGVLGLALIASYAPCIASLLNDWENPNYSHGYLVLPIALLIAWMRRDELRSVPIRPAVTGWVALLALLALRYVLYDQNELWAEKATIPLAVGSLVLALGGWRLLWKALPAVLFLFFILPLPPRYSTSLSQPLQRLATVGSTTLLQLMGLPVLAEGNVIHVGAEQLEVARACNGLSMLVSFVTLITATVLTVARDRPLWERAILLLSTIPIALIANILRIAGTAWLYHLFGPTAKPPWPISIWFPTVDKFGHDTAGWAMMPIALALVWAEIKLLSWLIVEEEAPSKPMLFIPAAAGGAPPVKK